MEKFILPPFWRGLIAAVAGGVVNTLAQVQQSGSGMDMQHVSQSAMVGALLGGCAYLVGHLHGQAAERVAERARAEREEKGNS